MVRMCDVLGVSSSGFYKWLERQDREPTAQEKWRKEMKRKISHFFHESMGTYGCIRIHRDLLDEGYVVSEKTVGRLMNELGLRATPKEKYIVTTDSNHSLPIYENLLDQNFDVEEPNHVWATDITYIWTLQGWVYLACVIDLFSRKVVGWALADHMKKELTLQALRMALVSRQPEAGWLHHSDRGSQYCSHEYRQELIENGAQISMSRKGNPYDNACVESFNATIKKELVYRRQFQTKSEAIQVINGYISAFYNERRRHSKLDYLSPNQYEQIHRQQEMVHCS